MARVVIWPLARGRNGVRYETSVGGGVAADGVLVTDWTGWIEVPSTREALARGAPERVAVRIRAAADASGETFLFAHDVKFDGRQLSSVFNIDAEWVDAWLAALSQEVSSEIERRLKRAAEVSAGSPSPRPSQPPPRHSGPRLMVSSAAALRKSKAR